MQLLQIIEPIFSKVLLKSIQNASLRKSLSEILPQINALSKHKKTFHTKRLKNINQFKPAQENYQYRNIVGEDLSMDNRSKNNFNPINNPQRFN